MTGATKPRHNDKLAAALNLARYGFNIFPLRPYVDPGPNATEEQIEAAIKEAKKPLIDNWQNLATNDESQVKALWSSCPDANIGISTTGLIVIDVDPWKNGAKTFEELARTGQLTGEDFPQTLAAGTQSGGTHIFYWLPDRKTAKGGVNKLGPGIDVKAYGGYVVGAGSTFGDKTYAWKKGYEPDKRDFAEAPQWLIDKCNAPRPKSSEAGKVIVLEDEIAIREARKWLDEHAPHARIGERGYTAFKVACRFYDYGVSRETCEELLIDWSESHCEAPMDRDDIEHAAYSALRNRDNAIGARHPEAPGFEPQEVSDKRPQISDTDPLGINTPAKRKALYSLSYAEAAERALAQSTEPLIDGLLDRQAMSVWYGESGAGKTFVLLNVSFHIASGRPWAEKQTRQGTVAYIAAEGGKGILKRIRALKERHADAGDIPLYVIPCPVDLLHAEADLKPLIAEIEAIKKASGRDIELVVIDTLSRAIAGGNENDSQDMGRFVVNLDHIRSSTRAHLAVVHHTGKDKAKGARGHSLLRAATDTEVEIDQKTLTVTKQRDMDGNLSMGLTLKPVRLGVAADGREITSCVAEMGAVRGPIEKMPLQPRLSELLEEIEGRLAETQNPDKRDIEEGFGWEFVAACQRELNARNGIEKPTKRTTTLTDIADLSEKGWLKKVSRNKWIVTPSGLSENVGNGNSDLLE